MGIRLKPHRPIACIVQYAHTSKLVLQAVFVCIFRSVVSYTTRKQKRATLHFWIRLLHARHAGAPRNIWTFVSMCVFVFVSVIVIVRVNTLSDDGVCTCCRRSQAIFNNVKNRWNIICFDHRSEFTRGIHVENHNNDGTETHTNPSNNT